LLLLYRSHTLPPHKESALNKIIYLLYAPFLKKTNQFTSKTQINLHQKHKIAFGSTEILIIFAEKSGEFLWNI
jgi:hypothetical protein